ncbi:high affinity immunoglobulin gamma Fc receptor I-like, partial [Micropterus dolomieu]|uniref:high affinity immunoglobulin gamma Fc receptor I-like n=1 Tax=Micropterus dolomieu TaxID=147949 RepID=UPI001E8CE4A6
SNRAVVTLQPNWLQIFSGEKFTVRCEIQGGGNTKWTYEWTPAKLNRPTTYNEYRISRATVSHSGDYSCKGRRDSYSSTEWSDVIKLTVSSKRPKAELSADRRDFPAGGSVTLSCSVNPSSGWKYFWYRGEKTSEPLNTQDAVFISDGQISVSQGGLYWCRGGRGDPVYYTEDSDPVSINKIIPNRAVVTLQPNWSEIYSGETITLRCEIKDGGDTEWEYEWETFSSYKPLKDSEYRIRYAYSAHSGDYRCKGRMKSAQQSSTDWSDPVKLTVSDKPQPVLTVSPSWLSPGASVTLSCRVKDPSA